MKTAQGRDLACVRARVQDCIKFSIITVRILRQRMAKMRLERQSLALGVFMSAQRSLDSEKQKPQQGLSLVPPAGHRLWEGRPVDGGGGRGGGRRQELRTKPALLSGVILELPRLHLVSSTRPGPRGPLASQPRPGTTPEKVSSRT